MHRALVCLFAASVAIPAAAQDQAILDMGRERTQAFVAGDLDGIWADMSPEMQSAMGSAEGLAAFRDTVVGDLGEEQEVTSETTDIQSGVEVYTRVGNWSLSPAPIMVEWAFGPEGTIVGFVVQPQPVAAGSAYLDYRTQADLRLPVEGEWFVFWGGRDIGDNYHAADSSQRFALDLVVEQDGSSYAGDPAALDNYHCWGREILAPAAGEVVAVVNDLPDQPIGETDPDHPAGNHVVLALAEAEFAILAHMQEGSVRVAEGDTVAPGEVLGLCGNSGNTSEPHLHFHLQTTPVLFEGEGLPAQFQDYSADGEAVARGEPVRGQTVAPR